MLRRLAVLVALGLAVAVPAAAAPQIEPARLAVAATSDHCEGGLPVVDFTSDQPLVGAGVDPHPDLVGG